MALLQELPAPETPAQRRAHCQVRTLLERASAPWVEDCPNGEVLPGQTSAEVEATIPAPATGELESVADYFAKVKIACSDFVHSWGTIDCSDLMNAIDQVGGGLDAVAELHAVIGVSGLR